ncbi:hypothetical protein [Metallibacterium sp.]|uniref:hypothetical protein n=1 Tax=Metallibacterium sp. TaxID=2940281 RepID=UPI002612B804|nr:hypothetical protein [Metallibacterium sp.]
MPNPDPPSPQSKVTRLPTELTHLFERTLEAFDAAEASARREHRTDPPKQDATSDNPEDLYTGRAAAQELDLGPAVPVNDVASNMGAGASRLEPVPQALVDEIRGEILEAAIGLGFLLVGIAVFVALAVLPHKPGMWIFMFSAGVLMFAGGRRIDAATRTHRRAKHSKNRRAQ